MKPGAQLKTAKKLPIRVLVADGSAVVRTAVKRMLESDDALQVVGTAYDGADALQKTIALRPDVIALDIEIDPAGGRDTLRRIMAQCPLPVVMLSPASAEAAEQTLQALDEGAFDYVQKDLPRESGDISRWRCELVCKLKAAARAAGHNPPPQPIAHRIQPAEPVQVPVAAQVVCIGSSTGGPKALQQILPSLPAELPAAILLVQHMPPGFTAAFARRLDSLCGMEVREARSEEVVEPGLILVAPAGWHMLLHDRKSPHVRLSKVPENLLHRPSVDLLMNSAAEVFQAACMGIILTGMGSDGAQGMKGIFMRGGQTVGQDENSCAVYGMPRSCAEQGVLRRILPLSQISDEILLDTGYKH